MRSYPATWLIVSLLIFGLAFSPQDAIGKQDSKKLSARKPASLPPREPIFQDVILELSDAVKNNRVKMDFNDIGIMDLVQTISKMTQKNFIVSPKLPGRITILGPSEVTVQEAYYAFLTALKMNNLTIVPEPHGGEGTGFLRIIPDREAHKAALPLYGYREDAPPSSNFIIRLYRLTYLDVEEVRSRLSSMVSPSGRMVSFPPDVLIITDTGANVQRITSVIKALDVRGFQGELEVIPVKYATVAEIAEKLDLILDEGFGQKRTQTRGKAISGKKTAGGGIIESIIPYERSNSLIVKANKRGLQEIKSVLAKLDLQEQAVQAATFHVYPCQNANSEELAKTVSSIVSGIKGQESRARTAIRRTIPGPEGAATAAGLALEGEIKVTADKPTNSVVVTGSLNDFESVKRLLVALDVRRLQVFVEALFLEVNVADNLTWEFNTNVSTNDLPRVAGFVPNPAGLIGLLSGDAGAALTGLAGFIIGRTFGRPVTIKVGGKTITTEELQVLLKFLITNSFANVLSRPTLLVLNNEDGAINIKDKIPVLGSTTVGVNGNVQSIKEVDTGIQLKLTPQVNESGFVRMKLEQTVSEAVDRAVPAGLVNTNVTVASREASTTIVVKDGDTVVIGGLIRDKDSDNRQKVPLVGDIPILGWLFKTSNRKVDRVNLLMFITPHVISSGEDFERIRKNSLYYEREKFMDENFGGQDIFHGTTEDAYHNRSTLQRTPPPDLLTQFPKKKKYTKRPPAPMAAETTQKPQQSQTSAVSVPVVPQGEEDILPPGLNPSALTQPLATKMPQAPSVPNPSELSPPETHLSQKPQSPTDSDSEEDISQPEY